MTSLQKKQKRKDPVGTAKDLIKKVQKKFTGVKAGKLTVAFPNKDMFKNVF